MKPFLVYIFLVGVPVMLVIAYILYNMRKRLQKYEQENFTGFGKINKYDAYQKCVKIINSCETYPQWLQAIEIPRLYYQLYGDSFLEGSLSAEWDYAKPDDMIGIKDEDYE